MSKRSGKSQHRDILDISHEVENAIAYARRHKCRKNNPQPGLTLKTAQERWIEKQIYQELFEIKVVTVPEFGDRP